MSRVCPPPTSPVSGMVLSTWKCVRACWRRGGQMSLLHFVYGFVLPTTVCHRYSRCMFIDPCLFFPSQVLARLLDASTFSPLHFFELKRIRYLPLLHSNLTTSWEIAPSPVMRPPPALGRSTGPVRDQLATPFFMDGARTSPATIADRTVANVFLEPQTFCEFFPQSLVWNCQFSNSSLISNALLFSSSSVFKE